MLRASAGDCLRGAAEYGAILTTEVFRPAAANFGTHRDYRVDLDAAKGPLTMIAGANDELMFAGKYEETVAGAGGEGRRAASDNTNHMDVVSTAAAVSVISEDIATRWRAR